MPTFDLPTGAAFVVITATTGIIWSLLCLAIRIHLRLCINGPMGKDDHTCIAATIVAVLQSIITLAETHVGLGRHAEDLSSLQLKRFAIMVWIHLQLYLVAITLSKISVCLLIARMTKTPKHLYASYSIIAASSLWAGAALVAVVFQCRMPRPWDNSGVCVNRVKLWTVIQSLNIVLELFIFKTACFLVWDVMMPRKPKAVVLLAFSMRLLTVPPLVYNILVTRAALTSSDKSFSRVNVTIASQIVLHISIICATIPCVKPFLSLFNTRTMEVRPRRPLLPFHRSSRGSRGSDNPGEKGRSNVERRSSNTVRSGRPTFRRNESSAKWRDNIRISSAETVTTVEHIPLDTLVSPLKRKSISGASASSRSESSSHGIEWSRSFAVYYEDMASSSAASGEARPDASRHPSTQVCTPTALEPSSSRYRAG